MGGTLYNLLTLTFQSGPPQNGRDFLDLGGDFPTQSKSLGGTVPPTQKRPMNTPNLSKTLELTGDDNIAYHKSEINFFFKF